MRIKQVQSRLYIKNAIYLTDMQIFPFCTLIGCTLISFEDHSSISNNRGQQST